MARNPFADPLSAGQAGWDDTQSKFDGLMAKRAGYRAGPKIAAGDYRSAAGEYGAAGMADEARTLMGDAEQVDQRQYQRGRQDRADARQSEQDDLERSKANLELLAQVVQGLKHVPAGQRVAALQRALPIFKQAGIDPSHFSSLTEDQLSDNNIDMFTGQAAEAWQAMNLGNGGIAAFKKGTGAEPDVRVVREPDPPPVIVGNGAAAVDRGSGQVLYRNPKTFAPPRPAGGGRPGAFVPKPTGRSY